MRNLTEGIIYVGVDDFQTKLFENQYPIVSGVSYNSYVIRDEAVAVMDTVDEIATDAWFDNLEEALDGKAPDYLIVSHLEPDHSANIERFLLKYPETVVVANEKTFNMLPQFVSVEIKEDMKKVVKEGDKLSLGKHELQFFMAPMVHWPEVMVAYESTDKILFSADGFGMFGALNGGLFSDEVEGMPLAWTGEARRYYANIVGKYGAPVQTLLKKAAGLDISIIAPLHGLVLRGDLDFYIDMYKKWSSYEPEEEGVVIAYATLHGNTGKAAEKLAEIIRSKSGCKVAVFDLSRIDVSYVIAAAFRWSKLVLMGVTYDAGLMPSMEDLLYHLKIKNVQKRKVAIVQNGSWAPASGKLMLTAVEGLKDMEIYENVVTIKTRMTEQNIQELTELANWL
ncbi:MAG: FprA family A-type flavoprotein [Lachnospira sp.]|nr:FprA family A-type flavoprotein [Lachnospira sp.]